MALKLTIHAASMNATCLITIPCAPNMASIYDGGRFVERFLCYMVVEYMRVKQI